MASCPVTGKHVYVSMEMAVAAVDSMKRRHNEPKRRARRLGPFRCAHCKGIHVGHTGAESMRRRESK